RIGRVHRLGQTRDAHIYNMATKDTIEEHIVALLHDKLNLFRAVVGDEEAACTRLRMNRTFEQAIAAIVLDARDGAEVRRRLDELAARVEAARAEALRAAEHARELSRRILSGRRREAACRDPTWQTSPTASSPRWARGRSPCPAACGWS